MNPKRRGRPAEPLGEARELITKRIRRLVDLAHDGNVYEASKVSGVPAATLRKLYIGSTTNPSAKTLKNLGDAYGIPADWFMATYLPERLPYTGFGFVVCDEAELNSENIRRMFMFPWTAWPLPDVYRRLRAYLLRLPPSPARPIIGGLSENDPCEKRRLDTAIGLFLIAPLDAAQRLAGELPDDFSEGCWNQEMSDDEVRRLRKLGQFWEEALAGILGSRD